MAGEQASPPLPSSIRNGRSASSHRARLRRRGVPWLRTALRFVCSPLQPFGPPMCGPPLLIGLTTACFRHRRRPSCAPPPVSAKILRIFGRGNCKEAIFALKNGIFRRKNRPVPAVHAAGDDCTAKGLRSSIHNGRLAAPNGLQRSLVHWTFASPVSATGGGEAPSLSRSPRDF